MREPCEDKMKLGGGGGEKKCGRSFDSASTRDHGEQRRCVEELV